MNTNITIIIPIHNKEKYIEDTINSIKNQKYKNYNLILLMDNCTDNTESIINNSVNLKQIPNYKIYYSKDNKHKKSGALNQLFTNYRDTISDYVMILDADTVIDNETIIKGISKLLSNDELGAVCSKAGITEYNGNTLWQRLLWGIQHIEYAQFDSHRVETEGRIKVVHGMCAIFKKEALLQVMTNRNEKMNISNNIYLEDNLVEDYELTIMLKTLGWKVSAYDEMKAFTEVPLSLKELYIQRLRWLRGGVDTLRLHGLSKVTIADKFSNIIFIIMNIMKLIILYSVIMYVFYNSFYIPNKIVMTVFILINIDSLYRMKYLDRVTFTDIVIKLLILPEILYFWFQTYIMMMSLIYSYLEIEQNW